MKHKSESSLHQLVLLRHGESIWNKENLFTGWTDVDLSDHGAEEARNAGALLKEHGFAFDIAFTSVLKRSIRTLWIVLDEMDLMWIPVHKDWRLNERHYGALQGLNKADTAKKFGEEQVKKWRRSYDVRPPALEEEDPRNPRHDARYGDLGREEIPSTECLKDTLVRFLPCWRDCIEPAIFSGKRVLITAHGNSLRALIKNLDGIPDAEISELNIPTGIPLVYELDGKLDSIRHYYLGDEARVQEAMQSVADQASVERRRSGDKGQRI